MPLPCHDPALVLAIELEATHLAASAYNTSKRIVTNNLKVELDTEIFADDKHFMTKKESGLAIRCLAKALDHLLEGMHTTSPSMFRSIDAIVIAAGVDKIVEVEHDLNVRLSSLNPQGRLEEQMPEDFPWLHHDSSISANSGHGSSKALVSSLLVPMSSILQSFMLGRLPRGYSMTKTEAGTAVGDPNVDFSQSIKTRRYIGPWLIDRFGANPNCIVFDNLPSHIAAYLSFLPQEEDGGLSFGRTDCMVIPLDHRPASDSDHCVPNPLYLLEKYPRQKPWLYTLKSNDAGRVRDIVRDSYTKTWSAFDQLLYAVCPGGSVGLDNKLFSFYVAKGPSRGIHRYENGTQTSEFGDLRANVRCIVESQALTLRGRLSRLRDGDVIESSKKRGYTGANGCMGFNPRNGSLMLPLYCCWGQDTVTNGVLDTFTQVLGAPIYYSKGVKSEEADYSPSRAMMGAAYYGIYSLHLNSVPDSKISFRDYISDMKTVSTSMESQRSKIIREPFLPCLKEGDSDSEQGTVTDVYVTRPRRRFFSVSQDEQRRRIEQRSRSSTMVSLPNSDAWCSSHTGSFDYATQMTSSPSHSSSSYHLKDIASNSGQSQSSYCTGFEAHHDDTRRDELETAAKPDEDLWEFYAALLEEHLRLSSLIEYKVAKAMNR